MSPNDPRVACDRLALMFERSLALRERGRLTTDDAVQSPLVPLVIAQLRMRIGPALAPGWLVSDPVHVVLCGGTNTGKSTVLNLLLGRSAAGMGVRARLSQHPEAYRPKMLGDSFLSSFPTRFAAYQRYRDEHPPRQSDDELRSAGYRPALAVLDPALLPAAGPAPAVTGAVLWDAPDFSTEEAQVYLGAVLDLLALADLVVVAVTDESYADDRAHVLLRLMSAAGVTVHVVANKLPDNPALLEDLARTLNASGHVRAPTHRLPRVGGAAPEERLANLLQTVEANKLREAVQSEANRGVELKKQGLRGALDLVQRQWEELVRPLAAEAALGERWGTAVERITQEEILESYRHQYLEGVQYGEFNRALVLLMELLQVPGIGPFLDLAGKAVRLPIRLAASAFRWIRRTHRGQVVPAPERELLNDTVVHWLAALKAEAQAQAASDGNEAWSEVVRRLDESGARSAWLERFEAAYSAYRADLDVLVRQRAEAIYQRLRQDPKRLNVLRGANLLGNALSVGLAVKSWGISWSDAVIGPAVAGLWQNLVEWGLGRYLETQRSGLKEQQFDALKGLVAEALAAPACGLFRGTVSADELGTARRDLALVATAVNTVLEGRTG